MLGKAYGLDRYFVNLSGNIDGLAMALPVAALSAAFSGRVGVLRGLDALKRRGTTLAATLGRPPKGASVSRHRFAFLLVLLLAASPVAAETLVKVGTNNVGTDVGFFIADKRGYFAAEGIKVDLIPFVSSAAAIAPLGTGHLDVTAGTVAAGLYNAVSRGVAMRIVADKGSSQPGHEYSTLLVRKDLAESGRYRSLADLKGMVIATAAQGAGSEAALNVALEKGGLRWSDVDVVHMGFPEQAAGFRNRRIDAGWTNEPTVTLALREGLAVRASETALYPGQQTAVVIYSEAFARRRPLAEAFMRAYLRGVRDYMAAVEDGRLGGPAAEGIIDILVEYTPLKDRGIYRAMTAFVIDPNGAVNTVTLQRDLGFYRARGLVPDQTITAAQLVDPSFAEAAARSLGPVHTAARD